MLGVDGKPHPGPGRPPPASRRRKPPAWATPSTAPSVAVFEAPEGEAGGKTYPDPYFGGEGPGARHLHRLRRLHDGLPLQRQKHASTRIISTSPRSAARGSSPKPRWWMCKPLDGSADGSAGYEVRTVSSTALAAQAAAAASPAAAWCSRLRRWARMDLLFRLKQKGSLPAHQRSTRQPRAHQRRIADRRARARAAARIFRRASPSARASTSTITRTSRRCAIRRARTPWACWPPCSPAAGPARTRILLWLGTLAGSLLRHPIRTVRCLHPFGWARESLILLCMQTLDGHIDMRLGRPLVLAVSQDAGEPGPADPHVHPAGQRIRAQARPR